MSFTCVLSRSAFVRVLGIVLEQLPVLFHPYAAAGRRDHHGVDARL